MLLELREKVVVVEVLGQVVHEDTCALVVMRLSPGVASNETFFGRNRR